MAYVSVTASLLSAGLSKPAYLLSPFWLPRAAPSLVIALPCPNSDTFVCREAHLFLSKSSLPRSRVKVWWLCLLAPKRNTGTLTKPGSGGSYVAPLPSGWTWSTTRSILLTLRRAIVTRVPKMVTTSLETTSRHSQLAPQGGECPFLPTLGQFSS